MKWAQRLTEEQLPLLGPDRQWGQPRLLSWKDQCQVLSQEGGSQSTEYYFSVFLVAH